MRRLVAPALLGVLLAGCSSGGSGEPAAATPAADVDTVLDPCPAQPDEPADGEKTLPALSLDCLGGGELDTRKAPGTPTVVNLWASWCGPCREELPLLQQLADAAAGEVQVVGVISNDGVPQADAFATDSGVTFPGAFDGTADVMTGLGVKNLPLTAFLAADGSVAFVKVGPVRSLEEFQELVSTHLGVQL